MANKKVFTDESLATFVDEIKSYTDDAVSTKANSSHTHSISNVTNLQSSLDSKSDSDHTHIYYGTCSTAAATAAKTVTVPNFKLETGAMVIVKFTNANSIASPTLNVNGTGAKNICRYGTTAASTGTTTTGWRAGAVQIFVYDGTSWVRDFWENTTYSNVSLGQGYATCSTAEATTAKVGTLSSYTLSTGGIVAVKFTYAVPSSATLNINSKGAKAIYYRGAAITAGVIKAGDIATFMYNGSQYHLLTVDRDDNTTYSAAGSSLGLVKSGGDVTISSGTITVNDDSHNHVISNIDNLQSTLDGKQATITGGASTITSSNLTASRALVSDSSGKVAVSAVTSTELGYLDGVTSAIQTQIDGKAASSHNHSASNITSGTMSADRLPSASDSAKGIVQLDSSVTSTSTTTAATSKSVKLAYDLANSANTAVANKASKTHTHAISDITNLETDLNNRVSKNGDTMIGDLVVETTGSPAIKVKSSSAGITGELTTDAYGRVSISNRNNTDTGNYSCLALSKYDTSNNALLQLKKYENDSIVGQYEIYHEGNPPALSALGLTATSTELNYVDGVTSAIQTQLDGKAASSHTHATSDITSGTLGVARGGTGKATHTSNAVLTGNGTSAVKNVATASGALYATAANGAAKFGTLPIAQGGTGATTAAGALTNFGLTSTSTSNAEIKVNSITIGSGKITYDADAEAIRISFSA